MFPEYISLAADFNLTYNDSFLENTTDGQYIYNEGTDTGDRIISFLRIYFAPILLFFGTLGNILSAVVFSRPALNKSATSFYFRVLAVADTLALNVGLWPNWMRDAFGVNIYPLTEAACRIQTYIKFALPDCAVWVLVIMTLERVIGVCWPHKVRQICTRTRIRGSVIIMTLSIWVINIPSIWINSSNNNSEELTCVVENHVLAYDIWPWIDLTIYSLLPFFIMMTCNITIIYTVFRSQRSITRDGGNKMTAMTVTLLIVTFVFFLLTAPFVIYSCTADYLYNYAPQINYLLFYFIASFLRYVNNSVNFPLYCMSGRAFRRELKRLFHCNKVSEMDRSYINGTKITHLNVSMTSLDKDTNFRIDPSPRHSPIITRF